MFNFEGQRFLITQPFLCWITGSAVVTLELATFLKSRGASVDVYTGGTGSPCIDYFNDRHINVKDDPEHEYNLSDYDYVWCHSQFLPPSFFKQLSLAENWGGGTLETPAFIFNHMSCLKYAPDEAPYIPQLEEQLSSLSLFVSQECMDTLHSFYTGKLDFPISLFSNPAPMEYCGISNTSLLRQVFIVSNHAPEEVLELKESLSNRDIEVRHFGSLGDDIKLITPDLLKQADVVVTIGKTVQYCLVADIPVYVYDHFGGWGYLNDKNFDAAAYSNFSGRGGTKKTSEEIAEEIISCFEDAKDFMKCKRNYFLEKYSNDKVLDDIFESMQARKISPLDDAVAKQYETLQIFNHRSYSHWVSRDLCYGEIHNLSNSINTMSRELSDLNYRFESQIKETDLVRSQSKKEISRLERDKKLLNQKLSSEEAKAKRLSNTIDNLRNSNSWKIGRVITFVPRLLKRHLEKLNNTASD